MRVDLWARVDLRLFSELEGRIPIGHYKDFFEAATTLYLEHLNDAGRTTSTDRGLAGEGSPGGIDPGGVQGDSGVLPGASR